MLQSMFRVVPSSVYGNETGYEPNERERVCLPLVFVVCGVENEGGDCGVKEEIGGGEK